MSKREKGLTVSQKEVADHFIITVDQFYSEKYDEKIASGECRVVFLMQPPSPNAHPLEKQLFLSMGNVINIIKVKLFDRNEKGVGYYGMYDLRPGEDPEWRIKERADSYIGVSGDHQLLVFPQSK